MAVAGGPGPEDGESADADSELVDLLVTLPPDDPRWMAFRAFWAERTRGALCGLLHHGHLGDPAHPPSLCQLTPEERAALVADPDELTCLADEAVVIALGLFERRQRAGDGWRPEKGRSLRSYLVHGGVFALADLVRRWRRDRDVHAREIATEPAEVWRAAGDGGSSLWSSISRSPEALVVTTDELRRVLDTMRSDDLLRRAVLERHDTGDSWADIADRIGTSVKNLEKRLARFRADWGKTS
ncbi:hypothetical protein [Actinomycetospora flava]|uniref:DNA-directed RNA polymerase specialized sigma24 family protein n=1 Tax=Actinomycetospora flava TaxID=3129232 RepID=A0ABU8M518_9PSEU